MNWSQNYSLFGCGLVASAALASPPILAVLLLLGILRKPSWMAGLAGLTVTLALALVGYHMPVITAFSAACEGAAFGLFPISWIVFWAIALFRVTSDTGQFTVIKDSIARLTPDPRIQVLLIAFAFGAFVEGAAGFGTPVAIASTMLAGLGFSAFDASALCLLANTAPVAFGSIGIPILTLALTTGLPVDQLSASAGLLCTPVALILPGYLIVARWGWRGLREVWLPALTAGIVFSGVQLYVSTRLTVQLTDILASLAAIAALIAVIRFRQPGNPKDRTQANRPSSAYTGSNIVEQSDPPKNQDPSRTQLLYAWMPYAFLVVCVLLWGWPPLHRIFESLTVVFRWPMLHDIVLRVPPIVPRPSPYHAIFNLNWCAASGTSCMVATLLSALAFRMRPVAFARLLLGVTRQLLLPTVTVTSVLAMAFLMNYCGATATLGLAFAATGPIFPFFSAILGWLGVFLTGSDTSSNALFGNLQTVTAARLGFNPVAIAAVNSVGGVMGKMISLQTIAVAAAATGISVPEQARLFRFTLKHSILLVCFVGLLAMILVRLQP
ncbi:MAG TPA: L-lactate permease [Terracidiphilus sp.]|jgi:L-lactate transport|nr:L-lactate permease [Terracidiphilus sp.]